jgi:hypothetical protein
LLDELRETGVAAYVTPVEPSTLGGIDRPEFRTEVRDRLFVDAAAVEQARRLLATLSDEIDTSSDDLAWAQIVSGFDLPVADDTARWPASEDVSAGPDSDKGPEGAAEGDEAGREDGPVRRRTPADIIDARHTAKLRAPGEEGEERFVPPTPPPLPRLEPRKQVAWVGVIGGPVLLLVSVLFGIHLPSWLSALAVGGFVIGFVALVAMMGGGEDDPWDDGAVV